jgi:two-component system sensor histidine kinase KdpD
VSGSRLIGSGHTGGGALRVFRAVFRYCLAVSAVAFLTWIAYAGLHVNSSTAAFSYLLLILALATRVGLAESITASLVSVLTYNYFFLPPIGALTIADPENWVALVVFLITAITASQLSASAKRKEREAAAREQEMQRMYEFSRALMLKEPDRTVASQAIRQLSELFGVNDAWFYDAASDHISGVLTDGSPVTHDTLRQVAQTGTVWNGNGANAAVVPVGLGGRALGSLGVAGPSMPSLVVLQAIAQLAAIAIESARAQEAATRLEATRQNEQLKSTLLDALAHEFKTPLTSIKAATTTLLPRKDLDTVGREMITIIDEEADRMNSLVSDSIELARIGSGPVKLEPSTWSANQLITAAVSQLRMLVEDREVQVVLDSALPDLYVDRKLTELVLREVIGNALKFSPPSSPIKISSKRANQFAVIRVRNAGIGIPKNEQEAVFEKFYRSRDARDRVAGTGMGLAIAREIVEAHGGQISVESRVGNGAEFSLTFPLKKDESEMRSA